MDLSSKINKIMNDNFRGYSASNNTQSCSYSNSSSYNSSSNIYYNYSSGCNNTSPNTQNGIVTYRPNDISLSFSQNHCRVSG